MRADSIIDFAKVTQMLDNGWRVRLERGGLGSYVARGQHHNSDVMERVAKVFPFTDEDGDEGGDWDDGWLITDDFTLEQALTRLAYKVHGEILISDGASP